MKFLPGIIFLLFFTLSESGFAQGITGRRLVLSYNMHFMSSYGLPARNPNLRNLNDAFIINTNHIFEMDWILSRSWVIGPDWHTFKIHSQSLREERAFLLNNSGFGFHIKTFSTRKGGIAPLGFWWKLRVYRNTGTATREIDDSYAGSYQQWDMSISLGKQVSFKNYFLFNIGVGFDSNNMYYRFEEDTYITRNNLEYEVKDSLLAHQVLFIKLGLGWLVGK
ncbi:MAG: hypothetical protein KDD63_27280 [Bacteroidetes bacterium]|nr:hypothetical protein [Bacteroidota bacterium]